MNNCTEFYLDDVMAITAIKLDSYTEEEDFLSPTINYDFRRCVNDYTIVVGHQLAVDMQDRTKGELVPIINSTGKVKDAESDAVAGRLHTVTVECEVDDRDADKWPTLRELENRPSHLVLTLRDGSQAFVRSSADTYLCTVGRGDGNTKLSIRIQNTSGLQLIA